MIAQPPSLLRDGEQRTVLGSALGVGVSPRLLDTIVASDFTRVVSWPAGSIAAHAGDPQEWFLVVLAGRLQVGRSDAHGHCQVLDFIGPGEVCGAVSAFAGHPRWVATVHVAEDTRALAIDATTLMRPGSPDEARQVILQNCLRILAGRALHLNGRLQLVSRASLRQKLATFLLRAARDSDRAFLSMTRQELADMIVASRASMTRELGRMADEGLIEVRGREIVLTDRAALRALLD